MLSNLRLSRRFERQTGVAQNSVDWCANLVAHVRQKLTFGLVSGLRHFPQGRLSLKLLFDGGCLLSDFAPQHEHPDQRSSQQHGPHYDAAISAFGGPPWCWFQYGHVVGRSKTQLKTVRNILTSGSRWTHNADSANPQFTAWLERRVQRRLEVQRSCEVVSAGIEQKMYFAEGRN